MYKLSYRMCKLFFKVSWSNNNRVLTKAYENHKMQNLLLYSYIINREFLQYRLSDKSNNNFL